MYWSYCLYNHVTMYALYINLRCLRKTHTLIRNSSCFIQYQRKISALVEIYKLKFIYHSYVTFFKKKLPPFLGNTLKLISVILLEANDVYMCVKFFILNFIIRFYLLQVRSINDSFKLQEGCLSVNFRLKVISSTL